MNAVSATPHAAAAAVARKSYGRLLSWLSWQWNDIALAEDALSEALVLAIEQWPQHGVPVSPEGWLLTTAKRKLLHTFRHQRLTRDPAVTILLEDAGNFETPVSAIPDARLRMMFVCAHPAIDVAIRPALMMQVVLGLSAERIASAMLITPQAMTKRLFRAKAKIRSARIPFEEPGADHHPERLNSVLEAIYGAFVLDGDASSPCIDGTLAEEALFLARLSAAGFPENAEALGLNALILYSESRRHARTSDDGLMVPIDQQDMAVWDADGIAEADALLITASRLAASGAYQLEAAIQAAHCHRPNGVTPWADIVVLYQCLLDLHPTVGARIGYAIAQVCAGGPADEGLAMLHALALETVGRHPAWWAAQAYLFQYAGRLEDAASAYTRALVLTHQPNLRAYLQHQLQTIATPHDAEGASI